MSTGILVTNDEGHVLITSDYQAFHYSGTASYLYTGLSGLTDFPYYAGDYNTLSGRHIHKYAITIPTGADPLVFIRPGNDLAYGVLRKYPADGYYGVTESYEPRIWHIEVLQRGRNAVKPMSLICFHQLKGVTEASTGHGLLTRTPDGFIAFDSNLGPLSIQGAFPVIPPTVPCDGGIPVDKEKVEWRDTILSHDFKCENTENDYPMPSFDSRDVAFTAPALSQAVYSLRRFGYKKSRGTYSTQDHWSTAHWWCMYQTVYRLSGSSSALSFKAGWAPFAAGYNYSEEYEDGGIFGGSGGNLDFGEQPYEDTTINLVPNTAIFIDASTYAGDNADDVAIIYDESGNPTDPDYPFDPPPPPNPFDPGNDPFLEDKKIF